MSYRLQPWEASFGRPRAPGVALLLAAGLLPATRLAARADEPAVTVLADFEDASVAAQIGEVRNALAADCRASRAVIPARGQGSLALEIGATARQVSVACDLTFREPTRFRQADRLATFCWINEGEFGLTFRIRDARGQLFETPAQPVRLPHRWVYVAADLSPGGLHRLRGDRPLTYPLEVQGYRVTTDRLGRQTVFLDDLLVEHRVRPEELIHGVFEFNEPTRIYEPGSLVAAAVVLENRSREKALPLSVNLAWMRPDGSILQTQGADVNLPASGVDFRSNRKLDFSQRIREPGLYRLAAQARAAGWTSSNTIETAIAVTPSNRRVSRGRSTFFGVRTNLLREPDLDQMLEISVARDIGVNLLAIDTPWRLIEPKPESFDFNPLEPAVAALSQKDMAAMLVLTDPPDWLAIDSSGRTEQLARLIGALSNRFGERLLRYQLQSAVLDRPAVADQLSAVGELRQLLSKSYPKVEVLPPPIRVADQQPEFDLAAFCPETPGFPLVFLTSGDPAEGLRQLESFRQRGHFDWRTCHWWMHEAEPLIGAGHYTDAEDVLRYYVKAGAAGVAGVIWFDLRDDDNDPNNLTALRGLIRRDFSPKTSLLGYATTAGILTGYRCAGQVAGTPESFDSALFIGANRQVAVLLPHPNRVLPAVLAPVQTAPGELSVQDFERREQTVLTSRAPPLVLTIPRPLFVTLTLRQAQSEPQLGLAYPWLRLPATVFCGSNTQFSIEVDALQPFLRSYLQLRLPKDSPIDSSLSAVSLRAEAGETVREDVRLTPKPGRASDEAELVMRVSLEGDALDVPLRVRSLADVRPLAPDRQIGHLDYRIGELSAPAGQRATANAGLHVGYRPDALHVAVMVEDDRVVPYQADSSGQGSGDLLLLGVAREGGDLHAQASLNPVGQSPVLEPMRGTSPRQLDGWRCEVEAGKSGPRTYHITIPTRALEGRELSAGDFLLISVRYLDDDADGFPSVPLVWGGGLDGSRSTTDYRWVRLAEAGQP
jgi:hypothetical protein